jgi:hypothetical protein
MMHLVDASAASNRHGVFPQMMNPGGMMMPMQPMQQFNCGETLLSKK